MFNFSVIDDTQTRAAVKFYFKLEIKVGKNCFFNFYKKKHFFSSSPSEIILSIKIKLPCEAKDKSRMVICNKMTEMKENNNTSTTSICRLGQNKIDSSTGTVLRGSVHPCMSRNISVLLKNKRNTKAEFKRLKTILPSIRRKENVSKLDIILEAIKYIDNLQDQLIDRLSGPRSEREATLLALSGQIENDQLKKFETEDKTEEMFDDVFDIQEDNEDEEDLISLSDGYMSDPGLLMLYQDHGSDEEDCSSGISHASLEL